MRTAIDFLDYLAINGSPMAIRPQTRIERLSLVPDNRADMNAAS